MNNKKTFVITVTIVFIVFVLLTLLFIFDGKVSMNPAGTIGNTAGNLNNGGQFCEYNGKVYFRNSYDNGSLYSMDVNEGSIKKLLNADVSNILAGGKYLYYFRKGAAGDSGLGNIRTPQSFNRSNLDGSKVVGITRDTVVTAQLVDNYLYMLTSDNSQPSFYKMKIDKSEKIDLADYNINPASAVNGTIYYNGTQTDHYLYALNTTTHVTQAIWQGNLWYPIVEGDYVYYLDVANDYKLCRYSFSQDMVEVLTNNRVDCFNVGSGYIYYQVNGKTPSLNCMRTDGSEEQIIAEGNYTHINMTSQFVYFQEFGNETALYHTNLGSSSYGTFDSAKTAALPK